MTKNYTDRQGRRVAVTQTAAGLNPEYRVVHCDGSFGGRVYTVCHTQAEVYDARTDRTREATGWWVDDGVQPGDFPHRSLRKAIEWVVGPVQSA